MENNFEKGTHRVLPRDDAGSQAALGATRPSQAGPKGCRRVQYLKHKSIFAN